MSKIQKLMVSLLVLAVAVVLSTILSAAAAETTIVKSDTQIVGDLGIMVGDGSGLSAEYLAKTSTRIQAAILFLKVQGKLAEAAAFKGTENFSDTSMVSATNKAIMAYLKANPSLGWAGTGNNKFSPTLDITAQQFYKIVLDVLGYKTGVDYAYADTLAFAATKGLVRAAASSPFKNSDVATAIVEALKSNIKGSEQSVASMLVALQLMKPEQAAVLAYPRIDIMTSATLGNYLVDAKGMTLYYFTKDVANPNSCVGNCLTNWPIYYSENLQIPAGLNAADFAVFTREDGTKQSTYKGWPLYYFANDAALGDTKGDKVGGVWFVIKQPAYSTMLGTKTDLGNYLTDAKGMSLYYFDKDTKGISNCSGACLTNWPVYYSDNIVVPSGVNASDFGVIVRADGTKQSTFKGFPLYYYVKDLKAGDTIGQAVGTVWYVVDPAKFTTTTSVNTSVKLSKSDALGTYMVDANGMTLYTFSNDATNPNSCLEKCLAAWPIFYDEVTVSAGLDAADFGTLIRDDGGMQTTYKGWPLYYFIGDTNSGDTTGEARGNVWWVIDPAKLNPRVGDTTPVAKTYNIEMSNYAFSIAELEVEVGSTVTFTNMDTVQHNAVAVDGSFAGPYLAKGETYSVTFDKAGTFDYFCEPHKDHMTGKIIVK